MNELSKLISFGNRKMPKNVAIFNMAAAFDCPSEKWGMCQIPDKCYAKKAERLYPEVLPYRRRQAAYWLRVSPERFACEFIATVSVKKTKVDFLRFNESGDFHSQACLDKAEAIAKILKSVGIVTHLFTCRDDLDFSRVENIVISGSNCIIHNGFYAVKDAGAHVAQAVAAGYNAAICPKNCSKCGMCHKAEKKMIFVEMH